MAGAVLSARDGSTPAGAVGRAADGVAATAGVALAATGSWLVAPIEAGRWPGTGGNVGSLNAAVVVPVTGVAVGWLPSWSTSDGTGTGAGFPVALSPGDDVGTRVAAGAWLSSAAAGIRSEERRVGKECRSRWSPYH